MASYWEGTGKCGEELAEGTFFSKSVPEWSVSRNAKWPYSESQEARSARHKLELAFAETDEEDRR